jgi:hypothetical protein
MITGQRYIWIRPFLLQGGCVFSPGLYLPSIPTSIPPVLNPAFRADWQPFGREEESLSLATGIYRQPVVGINDIRDVSSVFTGWMTSPEQGPQKQAIHAMAGWMQTLGGGFSWSAEGFYKRISNQPVTVWNTDARFNTNLALAKGNVYGGDIRLEYSSRSFFGYIGYGYTFTEYISEQDHFTDWFGDPLQRFHPPHDRRHQINTNLSVNIGSYTASLGWQFGTGLPYTRPLGFDERHDFSDGLPNVRARIRYSAHDYRKAVSGPSASLSPDGSVPGTGVQPGGRPDPNAGRCY